MGIFLWLNTVHQNALNVVFSLTAFKVLYSWNVVKSCRAISICCFSDVDECTSGTHDCHANATCTNTVGSFSCQCNASAHYYGNGKTCYPHRKPCYLSIHHLQFYLLFHLVFIGRMRPKNLVIYTSENRSSSKGPVAKAWHDGFNFLDSIFLT